MNIKGIAPVINTTPLRAVEKVKGGIKSDESHERDANGQQSSGDPQQHREPMSDEMFQKAIDHLKQLPGVKEHNWSIEPAEINSKRFILVKDLQGHTIRRISEYDLWSLPLEGESPTGNLLKKIV